MGIGNLLITLLVVGVWGIIWGVATKVVINNKGYSDNWFWWGFFFGLIALIVACAKPKNEAYMYVDTWKEDPVERKKRILDDGGWECSCGKVNASYVSSCACGKNKYDILNKEKASAQSEEKGKAEADKIAAIKEYKALLDAGVLTQEEFENKKKQLLDL